MDSSRRIMRKPEVIHLVGYTDMHLGRLERRGLFPKRFKIVSNSQSGAVGWWSDEIDAWLKARPTAHAAA